MPVDKRIGSGVNAALGAVDFSPMLQGSMLGAQFLGQGIAQAGAGAGDFLKDIGDAKKKRTEGVQLGSSLKQVFKDQPEVVGFLDKAIAGIESSPLAKGAAMAGQLKGAVDMFVQKQGRDAAATQQQFANKLATDRHNFDVLSADRTQAQDAHRIKILEMQENRLKEQGGRALWEDEKAGEHKRGIEERMATLAEQKSLIDYEMAKSRAAGTSPIKFKDEGYGYDSDRIGAPEDAPRGRVHYASENIEAMDEANMAWHQERKKTYLNGDQDILELREIHQEIDSIPDQQMKQAMLKWYSGMMGHITHGEAQQIVDQGVGAHPVMQRLMSVAIRRASQIAADKNERPTDFDLRAAMQEIFSPLKSARENKRLLKEMEASSRRGMDIVAAESKYLRDHNVLLGFDPSTVKTREEFGRRRVLERAKEIDDYERDPANRDFVDKVGDGAKDFIEGLTTPADLKGKKKQGGLIPSESIDKLFRFPLPEGVRGPAGEAGEAGEASNLTNFVKDFEGWNPRAYPDYKQRSIGYGTKAKRGEKTITKEEAERRLAKELAVHRSRVESANRKHGYNWTPAQLDALTSFDYNTGRLEQLTNNGKRSNSQIASKITAYTKAGGKKLKGLERRRKAEAKLFTGGYS